MGIEVLYATTPINVRRRGIHPSKTAAQNGAILAILLAEITAAGSGGLYFPACGPSQKYSFDRGIVSNVPIALLGDVGGRDSTLPGSHIQVPANTDAVVLGYHSKNSVVGYLRLSCVAGGTRGSGVRFRGARPHVHDCYATGFPEHGYFADTDTRTATGLTAVGTTVTVTLPGHSLMAGEQITVAGMTPSAYNIGATLITAVPSADTFQYTVAVGPAGAATVVGLIYAGNCNVGKLDRLTAVSCGLDGIHVSGPNANAMTIVSPDCAGNGRYGYFVNSDRNTIVNPHASVNLGTVTDVVTAEVMTVDYYDDGGSNVWINPYTEGAKAFVVTSMATGGQIIGAGPYAQPEIWSGTIGTTMRHNADVAVTLGWDITQGSKRYGQVVLVDAGTLKEVRIEHGIAADSRVAIHNVTDNIALFTLYDDGTRIALSPVAKVIDVGAGGASLGVNATALVGAYGFKAAQPSGAAQAAVSAGPTNAELATLVNAIRSALVSTGWMKGSA